MSGTFFSKSTKPLREEEREEKVSLVSSSCAAVAEWANTSKAGRSISIIVAKERASSDLFQIRAEWKGKRPEGETSLHSSTHTHYILQVYPAVDGGVGEVGSAGKAFSMGLGAIGQPVPKI